MLLVLGDISYSTLHITNARQNYRHVKQSQIIATLYLENAIVRSSDSYLQMAAVVPRVEYPVRGQVSIQAAEATLVTSSPTSLVLAEILAGPTRNRVGFSSIID